MNNQQNNNKIEYKLDIESGNVGVYIDGLRKRSASVQELLLELINSFQIDICKQNQKETKQNDYLNSHSDSSPSDFTNSTKEELIDRLIKELAGEFGKESNINFRIEMVFRKVFGWEEFNKLKQENNSKVYNTEYEKDAQVYNTENKSSVPQKQVQKGCGKRFKMFKDNQCYVHCGYIEGQLCDDCRKQED